MAQEFGEEKLRKIAVAARLQLSEEEVKEFAGDLKSILDSFKQLGEADVDDLPPSFHAYELDGRLRGSEAPSRIAKGKSQPLKGPRAFDG